MDPFANSPFGGPLQPTQVLQPTPVLQPTSSSQPNVNFSSGDNSGLQTGNYAALKALNQDK